MSFLIQYFESLRDASALSGDQQYATFLNIQQVRARQEEIQREKLGCCGADLNTRGEPKLVIINAERFKALDSEFTHNAGFVARQIDSLNKFDDISTKAQAMGVEVPTLKGMERALVDKSNRLLLKENMARTIVEEQMYRNKTPAIKVSESPLVLEIEQGAAQLRQEIARLRELVEAGRELVRISLC